VGSSNDSVAAARNLAAESPASTLFLLTLLHLDVRYDINFLAK